jgi:hypothetical protein
MNEAEIYNKLEKLRAELNPASFEAESSITKVVINNEVFEQRIWLESYENSKLFVFLLEMEKPLQAKTYCLGLQVGSDGQTKYLSNEQLWNMGIP